MTDKLPTIDIKGKPYTMVKDRILAFNELYPNGSIETEIVSPLDAKTIVVKAIVIPDVKNPTRRFVDFSQAVLGQGLINTTSALENASTSAVGRALAYMGIGVIESVASADEVQKAISTPVNKFDHENNNAKLPDMQKCEKHQALMKKRNGAQGSFYSHAREMDDGRWEYCNGAGYPSEKKLIQDEEPPIDDTGEY